MVIFHRRIKIMLNEIMYKWTLFEPSKYSDADGIDRIIQVVSFIDVSPRWPKLQEYDLKNLKKYR